jgi:hypothetical protein
MLRSAIAFVSDPLSGDNVVVHELAHQWFGDSLAVEAWHIWLNEGFATYAEWLWSDREGLGTAQENFDFFYIVFTEDHPFWTVTIGDPGPDNLFNFAVYARGAMTLHQLRLAVGDVLARTASARAHALHAPPAAQSDRAGRRQPLTPRHNRGAPVGTTGAPSPRGGRWSVESLAQLMRSPAWAGLQSVRVSGRLLGVGGPSQMCGLSDGPSVASGVRGVPGHRRRGTERKPASAFLRL